MERRERGGLALGTFLFLIYGAIAFWAWVILTRARLSPDWRDWTPPFLVGGTVGLLAWFVSWFFGPNRRRD
jgi:hypothetical protein